MEENTIYQRENLPNSTSVLVLGILSIVTCWCYGIPGIVLAIIALIQAKKANEMYTHEPNKYLLSSFNNMKAGRICAIIGLVLSSLYILFIIIYFALIGSLLTSFPWQELNNTHYY